MTEKEKIIRLTQSELESMSEEERIKLVGREVIDYSPVNPGKSVISAVKRNSEGYSVRIKVPCGNEYTYLGLFTCNLGLVNEDN